MTDKTRNTMDRHRDNDNLSSNIRREMGGEMTTRFFRSLPIFQTAETLPCPFGELLARLDERQDGGRLRCA